MTNIVFGFVGDVNDKSIKVSIHPFIETFIDFAFYICCVVDIVRFGEDECWKY